MRRRGSPWSEVMVASVIAIALFMAVWSLFTGA